ncbi:MAG: hypothetical protein K1X95_03925 [Acidimicrobiia bacterium]|nr:hypothetical protein [Acidimicrobiia bacterium]
MVAMELESVSAGGLSVLLGDLVDAHERHRIAALDAELRGCSHDVALFTSLAETALRHSFEVLRALIAVAPDLAEDCARRLFAAQSADPYPT